MTDRPQTGYELKELKASVKLKAWGKDLTQLFTASAEGLFAAITDTSIVQPSSARAVELNAPTTEALLVEWLELINDLHQIQNEVYVRFQMTVKTTSLEAQIRGERFDVKKVAIVHRTGALTIGEASVAIAVSSAHRADGMEACRYLIDTLKKTVPIWKKEFFEGGDVWIEGQRPD